MAYRKNYRRRYPKRRGGRRRFKRAGAKAGSMAYSAYKMARKLMDAVNIEYKIFNATASGVSSDYTGTVSFLNQPVQGLLDTNRVGDSIKCQNLTFRFLGNRSTVDCWVRYILYWDQQNQVNAGVDMLENVGSQQAVISPKNYDNRFRTLILHDYMHYLTASDPLCSNEVSIPINKHTQFIGTTATITTGALKVLVISSLVAGATAPVVSWNSRLSFTDN